ncbi:hypothetical protein KCU95_g10923, partial [Aureobasidium melanogenum]
TAAGIPTWSPTVVLICRSTAYVWQSGRDAQFSADCGRTWLNSSFNALMYLLTSICQDLQIEFHNAARFLDLMPPQTQHLQHGMIEVSLLTRPISI